MIAAPEFRVGEPRIVGARLVSSEAIVQASGLGGESVFLVDPRRVERAVSDLRPIESVRVEVAWPNSVVISVVERQPYAVWQSGAEAFLVSIDGVVIGRASDELPPLTIRDLDSGRVFVGGQVDRDVIAQAGQLREGLTESLGAGAQFDYSRAEGLAATLDVPGSPVKAPRVLFGEGVGQKLETWRRIASELAAGRLKAEVVDLRIADRPFVR
jgi:cell division septal protein FtsQ